MAKREQHISPKGIFKYTHLNKPDHKGAERFNAALQYKVTLILPKDDPETKKMIANLEKKYKEAEEHAKTQMDEASAKQKGAWKKKGITDPDMQPFFDEEYDEDTGEPTGNIELRFKSHAEFKDKDTGKVNKKIIPFIDGRGQTIPNKKRPNVFAGTEGRVAFTTAPAFIPAEGKCFLSLYLNSVQITKLQSAGNSNPFGADEDSDFSAEELEDIEDNASDGDDDSDLDDGGDQDTGEDDEEDDEIPF